jgi:hypothetical protein
MSTLPTIIAIWLLFNAFVVVVLIPVGARS